MNLKKASSIFFADILSIDAPSSSIKIIDLFVNIPILYLLVPGVITRLREAIYDSKPLLPLYIDLLDYNRMNLSTKGI